MNILITGSNGFIGQYICNELKTKYNLIGVGTREQSINSGIKYFKANIENKNFTKLAEKVKKCDVIIHLAAYIDKYDLNNELININCNGSLNVLNFAKNIKAKKIINLSSAPVIGKPLILPITENHPLNPQTLYHATKLTAEHIFNLSYKFKIQPINLRIPSPIGPGMNENTFLPIVLKKCLNNEPITVYGKGSRKQNYIDVRDISKAIVNIIDNNCEGLYNIASKTPISNIDLVKLCVKLTGSKSEINFNGQMDPEDDYCWDISIEKARRAFSFNPKHELSDSIINILKYWESKGT